MDYIERRITKKLLNYVEQFPVVFLTGPRQSGKSTLLKKILPDYKYVNLEEADMRAFASDDPRGFLNSLNGHAVIDEAQRVPELFSYIQSAVDEGGSAGMFVLSGSQNFLLLKTISQSRAGRVGILSLLPFSFSELDSGGIQTGDLNVRMQSGFYPRLVMQGIDPTDFYPNYIKTYVERDIRAETGLRNVDKFTSFIRICAQGAGTTVNLAQIGASVEADARTIASWINILEESYIIFRLRPFARKIVPRYSKKPKIYFYDTGLLSSLLRIKNDDALKRHKLRGLIFENMVVAEYFKQVYNAGGFPGDDSYFWRDGSDRDKEVDLVVEDSDVLKLYEIKSSETANSKFADNLNLFEKKVGGLPCEKHVIYNGPNTFTKSGVEYMQFRNMIF
ncbi:MAG: ATP-binding protein [Clostridiales Family XIII bacterium]|jgi:predicted AAA+ superfamily ATPase|nr:ATP-binding protein [Clostridiales Family XIII bacterium]